MRDPQQNDTQTHASQNEQFEMRLKASIHCRSIELMRRAENENTKTDSQIIIYYVIDHRQEQRRMRMNKKKKNSRKSIEKFVVAVAVAATAAGRRRKSRLRTISECFHFFFSYATHRFRNAYIFIVNFILSRASEHFRLNVRK